MLLMKANVKFWNVSGVMSDVNVKSDRSEGSQLENRSSVWIKATGTRASQTRGRNCATWLYRESEGILTVPVCLSEVECNRVDVI